jgi:D-lactate dehydrogenase
MSKKISVALYGLWPELKEYTRKKLREFSVTAHVEPLNKKNLISTTEVLVVFIDSTVTREIIETLPKLRCIVTMSTGYDHIDLVAAKERGILVTNVPTYGENTVAEHTFALILGLTRKLFQSVKRVKEGRYDFVGLTGTDIAGKTLGVIGTGHIGARVARIAKGFEMKVLAYDAYPNEKLADTIGFEYASLSKVLRQSDIVTLHTPLLKTTYHLIDTAKFALMKQGSYLINTARGALVNPEALLGALQSGRLAGAGLDVLEDEQLLQHFEEVMHGKNARRKLTTSLINNTIIDHPNTIVTPHNAFNSAEALRRIMDVVVENIQGFVRGTIHNRV